MSMKTEVESLRHNVEDEREEFRRLTAGLRTRAQLGRRAVEAVLFIVLAVGSGLLFWGSSFAHGMVHDQLAAQHISFPAKGSAALDPKEFPGLQRYAGQAVDNGPKAKAYANQFIAAHLKSVAGGKTYSEVSTAAQQKPSDQKLQAQAQTLFRGETLRGLLLYAWGWSLVGTIAFWVANAAFLGALVVLAAMVYSLIQRQRA